MDLKISTSNSQQEVSLGFGKQPGKVTGIQALVQQVLIELLSDYNPYLNRGAGLKTLVEQSSPISAERARVDIRLAIAAAKAHILNNQYSETQVLPSERLQDLRALRVELASSGEWVIDIEVTNVSGESTSTAIVL